MPLLILPNTGADYNTSFWANAPQAQTLIGRLAVGDGINAPVATPIKSRSRPA